MNLTLSFKHQTKKILALAGLLVASVAMISLANLALADSQEPSLEADERIVNIYDQGEERVIITKSRTVRQALRAANIEVNESKDVVEPALNTELVAPRFNVNIYRAKTITVVDSSNSTKKRVTTAQQTPEEVARAAKMELHKEDRVLIELSSDLLVDGVDTVMTIDRATPVSLTLFGKLTEVRTRASTVGELLRDKNIAIGRDDTLSVDKSAPIVANMSIEIWRNGKQTITVEEDVDFPVEKIQDANREIGYREVKTPGEKGKRNATYEIEMKNGQELSRKEIASVITKEPKKQVEIVGAKPSFSGDFQAALAKLRSCEGGYSSWNPAGPYYGAYQFDQRTWGSVADPAKYGNATPAEQDEAAYQLYLRRGWQPWPVCGKPLPDIYR